MIPNCRSKYHAKKVTCNGIVFDSGKEANRYANLLMLERAGAISELKLQKRYELIPAQYETYERYGKNGKRLKDGRRCVEKSVVFVADFAYIDIDGNRVVEDVKGYKNSTAYDVFVIKRKLMLLVHGIRVREV